MADSGDKRKEEDGKKILKKDQDVEIIFNQLKNDDNRVPLDKLLQTIKSAGMIIDRDPRFQELYQKCCDMSEGGCVKEAKVNYEDFHRLIESKKKLISNCVTKKLIIEDFAEFSSTVDHLYEVQKCNISGDFSNELPELKKRQCNHWGLAICSADGQRKFSGDSKEPFTLQNLCKPFLLGLTLKTAGLSELKKYIAFEPNGVGKDIIQLNDEGKPFNSMVNSGAIMLCALLIYVGYREKSVSMVHESFITFIRNLVAGEHLEFKTSAYISKKESGDELKCLSYGLKSNSKLPPGSDIKCCLELFLKASSLEVTAESLSIAAAVLANGGVNPLTDEKILSIDDVKEILSAMYSFGLYELSGESAFWIGVPMKSSISGGLLMVVPNKLGLVLYSPLLNEYTVSQRAYQFCKELAKKMKLHHFDNIGDMVLRKMPSEREKKEVCEPFCDLFKAAANNDIKMLLRLQEENTDFYITDFFGHTVLHVAAVKGSFDAIKFLLKEYPSLVHIKDKWGRIPKTYTNEIKNFEITKYLERFDVKLTGNET